MVDSTKKKKEGKENTGDVQRVQNLRVGDILRQARAEKKLDLEKVSASINIRVAQLRAIEEGDIDALPGMTYALGFVRSYANFLKLNSAEIVHKFKAEHGALHPLRTEMHFPEPIQENRLPGPIIIGLASFFVVVVLVLWSLFSGGDDENSQIAAQIQPPPVDVTTTVMSMGDHMPLDENIPMAEVTQDPSVVVPEASVTLSGIGLLDTPPPAAIAPAAVATVEADVATVASETPPAETPVPVKVEKEEPSADIINIKPTKGRVVISAIQSSWVEVVDSAGSSIYKKVMRPGDQYHVPDQKGLALITANAGGLEIVVDGKKVQSIGKRGQILRGIPLDPDELKKTKIRTRD